jgi:hypothetical protein
LTAPRSAAERIAIGHQRDQVAPYCRQDGVGLPDRSEDEVTLDIERFAGRLAAVV